MAYPIVSTRIRSLPRAVPSRAAEDFQGAADRLLGFAERRHAERLTSDAAQAQRDFEAQQNRLSLEAQAERLREQLDAEFELTDRRFEQRKEMFGLTSEFEAGESALERTLRLRLEQLQNEIAKRGQDLDYDLGMRGLAVDAVRAGAYANLLGEQTKGLKATRESAAQGGGLDPLEVFRAIHDPGFPFWYDQDLERTIRFLDTFGSVRPGGHGGGGPGAHGPGGAADRLVGFDVAGKTPGQIAAEIRRMVPLRLQDAVISRLPAAQQDRVRRLLRQER